MKASTGNRVLMLLENSTYPKDPRVRNEATTLIDAGYQVSVVCPRDVNEPWCENLNGVFVFRYPQLRAQGIFGYILEYMYSLVVTFVISLLVWVYRGFDIIHAANPPDTAVFIALFYKLFGKLFVFDHHDLAPELYLVRFSEKRTSFVYGMLVWLEKTSCGVADHVIATNESYKNVEMQRGHVPEDRITIVRNGPKLDRLRLVKPDSNLKKRGEFIIGYIGVIGPQDGLDYLLRSLHQLITVLGKDDFFCIIIGNGSALADLKTLANQIGLDQYVWFTGFISDADVLSRYLSTVDICVDPDPSNVYNDNCTMIKMMEYMALSKPIVAFDLPEHRVTAGEAAIYARPNDELDLARQIALLMDDPEHRKRMGEIGRERIEKVFAWPYQATHLVEAYKALATDMAGDARKPDHDYLQSMEDR